MKSPGIVILAGGKGTRLASVVSDVPKPLAPVLGRPFLDFLLTEIAHTDLFSSVTLALGHQAEKVIEHYRLNPPSIPLHFVVEKTLRGTGGGARFALETSTFHESTFVINGDSLIRIPFQEMLEFHNKNPSSVGTLSLVRVPNCNRFGQVHTEGNLITAFLEKDPNAQEGLINAGVYVFQTKEFLEVTSNYSDNFSLETQLFPSLAQSQRLFGFEVDSPFIDIGIPETYFYAQEFLTNVYPK